jgi:hypothetical protein
LVGFGFAGGAGVADFFAVFLFDGCNGFIFEVNKFGLQLKSLLGTGIYAFTAARASVGVYDDVVFA